MNLRQTKFVQFYDGNATQAAIKAGYSKKTAKSIGQRLLTFVDVAEAIKKRQDKKISTGIATRQDRQKLWTKLMKHKNPFVALRASQLLGKSEADFLDRIEHQVEISTGITVTSPNGRVVKV